jgi:alpha-L-rhamnosidase
VNRRSFLAGGIRVTTGAVVAGAVVDAAVETSRGRNPAPARGADAGSAPPPPPTALTATGVAKPVGVDPEDVLFAWRGTDHRRGAVQSGYRVVVAGPSPSQATVWDSGQVAAPDQAFVAYSGPTLAADSMYHWTVRTADGSGQWSESSPAATFTTGLRTADWEALWLRPGPADPGEEEYTYLRTTRSLPAGTVSYATAYVAVAHKYQLWINGTLVDTGPSFCFPDQQYYQATDITSALRAGRSNAIGLLHRWYGPGQGRPTSAPGLLAQVVVHYTDGRVVTIRSTGAWRTRRAEWLPAPQRNNDGGDFVEWIDGRRVPQGWSEAGFDDQDWTPAVVLGPVGTSPFLDLYAQRTRISEHEVAPASVRTLASGSVVVDFGKVYAGRPFVSFNHGSDGHVVPMHVGYTLDPDGSVSTIHNTQGTDLSFQYTQRAGAQSFHPFCYLGFRYLQIDDPGEAIGHGQVTLMARHATIPAVADATFTSSDPVLDQVWALCAHSGLYTSHEQFVDTPTREKGQFMWDATNESQTVMRNFGEQNLSWQGLRDMARAQARYWPTTGQMNEVYPNDDGPQDYPTFTAIYPEWVWRYYLSTGDKATLSGLLPTLVRLTDYLAGAIDQTTGLVSGLTISTNGDNQYGYDYGTEADTFLNILSVNAFRRVAAVADLVGNSSTAATQTQRMSSVTTAVNAHMMDANGHYVDGLEPDGSQSGHASQLANLGALAYGVVPAAAAAGVARYVSSLDISVEPDHGMELLRALHAGGRDADVVRILTDSSFPGWAAILKAGGTFTWETWTPSDLVGDSMSHGWGSSALVATQEILLGAVPVPPPADGPPTQVTITPPSAGLTHAAGTFPSPAGTYQVAWRTNGRGWNLSVTVPSNATARCTFPGIAPGGVTEGGQPAVHAPGVKVVGTGPSGVTVAVGTGTYDFVALR